MRGWPVAIVIILALFAVFYRMDTQDVFIYPTVDEVTITSAKAGELATLVGTAEKLRGECVISPTHTDTVITDATGNSFIVNQRSGMVLRLPAGKHKIKLQFEVPRLAAVGPAYVVFDNTYQCLVFEVSAKTPAYPFEVLSDD